MRYTFEWDLVKAKENRRKHGISFERASEIFLDSLAISVFDEGHSENEERWLTIGKDTQGYTLVVVHTHTEVSPNERTIRVILHAKPPRKNSGNTRKSEL